MKITGHNTEAVYSRYAIAPRASLSNALQTLAGSEHGEADRDAPRRKRPKYLRRAQRTD
jgi:hypothetical protein